MGIEGNFESKFKNLEHNETISLVRLVNDLKLLEQLCSCKFFSTKDMFYSLAMIKYDLKGLDEKHKQLDDEVFIKELRQLIIDKYQEIKISAEQLKSLFNYTEKLPLSEQYFDQSDIREVCKIFNKIPRLAVDCKDKKDKWEPIL